MREGMVIFVNVKESIMKAVANVLYSAAQIAAGASSQWGSYQPEEPEQVSKLQSK